MSRPRVYGKRVATNVRLPEDLHARLKDEADQRDVSVNYLVIKAVSVYLDQLVRVDNGRAETPPEADQNGSTPTGGPS